MAAALPGSRQRPFFGAEAGRTPASMRDDAGRVWTRPRGVERSCDGERADDAYSPRGPGSRAADYPAPGERSDCATARDVGRRSPRAAERGPAQESASLSGAAVRVCHQPSVEREPPEHAEQQRPVRQRRDDAQCHRHDGGRCGCASPAARTSAAKRPDTSPATVAKDGAGGSVQPDLPSGDGSCRNRGVAGSSQMARPGLEPGTPRSSGSCTQLSISHENPVTRQLRAHQP
jgi:hypothetical protein